MEVFLYYLVIAVLLFIGIFLFTDDIGAAAVLSIAWPLLLGYILITMNWGIGSIFDDRKK